MKLTMPEGLGLLGAVVVGVSLVLGSQAAQTRPVDDLQKTTRSVPDTEVDDPDDIPGHRSDTPRGRASSRDGVHASRPPREPRSVSLFALDTRRLEIQEYPIGPDGAKTYRCRGGLEILCKSPKFGTVSLEADEALIKRVKPKSDKEPIVGPNGETWFEEADVPMEVHLKRERGRTSRQSGNAGRRKYRVRALKSRLQLRDRASCRITDQTRTVCSKVPGSGRLHRRRGPTRAGCSWLRRALITLSHRDARPIEIKEMPREIDGTIKYVCKGGIRIVARFEAHGTASIDADDVVIVRKCRFGRGRSGRGHNRWYLGGGRRGTDGNPRRAQCNHEPRFRKGSAGETPVGTSARISLITTL